MESGSGSDFLLGFSLSGDDSGGNLLDAGHAVLALLELDDGDVGRVDRDLVRSSVGLVLGELVDLNGEFLSLNLDDFSLLAPVGAPDDENFVVLANGDGSDAVFLAEILGKGG